MTGSRSVSVYVTVLLGILTVIAWTLAFNRLGPAPALAPFLNPHTGFWRAIEEERPAGSFSLEHPDLRDVVTLHYDDQGIPHIFARNNHDLYFAQGWVTARDRLWQMDMIARAGSGRLAEVLGPRLLEYDIGKRRLGMAEGARVRVPTMLADPRTKTMVTAYAAGVNAWTAQLAPEDLPFEYKLLGFRPEPWTPLHSAQVAMSLSETLASGTTDLANSVARELFGEAYLEKLIWHPLSDPFPVIPAGTPWDFEPLPIPDGPSTPFRPQLFASEGEPATTEEPPLNGSNNWAVHGSRTASGYPLLANDPHLSMTLPAIWYTVHLDTPEHSVMGVSTPGAPSVLIGFNEDIAWGITNLGSDVLDLYEITYKDASKSHYLHGGTWRPVRKVIERIAVRGQAPVELVVPWTHHGPVEEKQPLFPETSDPGPALRPAVPIATRWLAHAPTNELLSLYLLNRAGDYAAFREALSSLDVPGLCFAFASTEGDIALQVAGRFPLRAPGQGRFISDGSDPAADWAGFIPEAHEPGLRNPPSGFVSSANQDPVDKTYPYELGDNFAPQERGRRIQEYLADKAEVTIEDMRLLLGDTYSHHAAIALPFLLEHLDASVLDADGLTILEALREWDLHNDPYLIAPSVFHIWWRYLYNDLFRYKGEESPHDKARMPKRDRAVDLLVHGQLTAYSDDPATPETETIQDRIQTAFQKMITTLTKFQGPIGPSWHWTEVNPTRIPHMAYLDGFGVNHLPKGGGPESVNAIDGSHGPSWRMVVELGPELRAYGAYPGGPSGNPASPDYASGIEAWTDNRLVPLDFPREAPAAAELGPLLRPAPQPRLSLPWWSLLPLVILIACALSRKPLGAAIIAGGSLSLGWALFAARFLAADTTGFSSKVAGLLFLPSPWLLVLITAITGALLAALPAAFLSRLLYHLRHQG